MMETGKGKLPFEHGNVWHLCWIPGGVVAVISFISKDIFALQGPVGDHLCIDENRTKIKNETRATSREKLSPEDQGLKLGPWTRVG